MFLHATCDDDGALLISLEAPRGRLSDTDIHKSAGQDGGAPIYNWRKKYGGISPLVMKHMRQLEEENLRLKKLVADLSLNRAMLQDVLAKKS